MDFQRGGLIESGGCHSPGGAVVLCSGNVSSNDLAKLGSVCDVAVSTDYPIGSLFSGPWLRGVHVFVFSLAAFRAKK